MVGKNSCSLHSTSRFLVDPPDRGRPWDFLIGFALGVICALVLRSRSTASSKEGVVDNSSFRGEQNSSVHLEGA